MVLGCGYKGLSKGVELRSKLKSIRVLALQITQAQKKDRIILEREIIGIKSKNGFYQFGQNVGVVPKWKGGFGGVLP